MKRFVLFSVICLLFFSCKKNGVEIKLIPVKLGDKWGYVNKEGKFLINPQFKTAGMFFEGRAFVQADDGKYGFINEDGKYIINPIYKNVNRFSEGLACVVLENGKLQFIDREGNLKFILENADECAGFHEGLAPFQVKGKWGFIDKTGKTKINPEYEWIDRTFTNDLIPVSKIDLKTNEVNWGYIDKEGAIKIGFQFKSDTSKWKSSPSSFSEGLAFVSNDGIKWGWINEKGNYEINPQFPGAELFDNYTFTGGLSLMKQGEVYGYIDRTGKYAINPQFKSAYNFSDNGFAAVQNTDGKWGFVNKEGKYIINPQFDGVINGFVGDFCIVESSGKYGLINEKGNYIANPQFDDINIYQPDWISTVESDYVDYAALSKKFFENSDHSKLRGISLETSLSNVVEGFPPIPMSDLDAYSLSIKEPKITIDNKLTIERIEFYFRDKTYFNEPVYKDVERYSYYLNQNVIEKEFDHNEKKVNPSSLVSGCRMNLNLERSGVGRSRKLADQFVKLAENKLGMKLQQHQETQNSEEKGLYLLRNDEFLLEIAYYSKKNEESSSVHPKLFLLYINKNYTYQNFDDTEAEIVKGYLNTRDKL